MSEAEVAVNLTSVSGYSPGHLLVSYRDSASKADIARLEQRIGGQKVRLTPQLGVRRLSIPAGSEDQAISILRRSRLVEFAERDALVSATETIPNDSFWSGQWSATTTRSPAAWSVTTGSSSVVIAVLDTGVDTSQPDLQGKLVAGYDFVNNDGDPSDDAGHGTSVAGIAGAATNNALGVAGYCWTCRIMPVKVLGADGSGLHSSVANGIVWATDNGARIVNMSLAGDSTSRTLKSAIDYAHRRGVLLVAAAGNSGSTSPTYPAAYPEVVGVAGTKTTDSLYSWSNRGDWVSVAAPGTNYTTLRGDMYAMFAGTSSAAPVVSGIAGLAIAFKPDATVASIRHALISGAVPIAGEHSFGRVDALETLIVLGAEPLASPSPSAMPTSTPASSATPSTPPSSSPTPEPDPTATASASPAPDPSPSPTASASPTLQPSPSASASPTAEPAKTSTDIFRGSISNKNPSRSYELSTGDGRLRGSLEFSGPPTLTIRLLAADGVEVARFSGSSVLTMEAPTSAGLHTVAVEGGGQKANFRLVVTYPTP